MNTKFFLLGLLLLLERDLTISIQLSLILLNHFAIEVSRVKNGPNDFKPLNTSSRFQDHVKTIVSE